MTQKFHRQDMDKRILLSERVCAVQLLVKCSKAAANIVKLQKHKEVIDVKGNGRSRIGRKADALGLVTQLHVCGLHVSSCVRFYSTWFPCPEHACSVIAL